MNTTQNLKESLEKEKYQWSRDGEHSYYRFIELNGQTYKQTIKTFDINSESPTYITFEELQEDKSK